MRLLWSFAASCAVIGTAVRVGLAQCASPSPNFTYGDGLTLAPGTGTRALIIGGANELLAFRSDSNCLVPPCTQANGDVPPAFGVPPCQPTSASTLLNFANTDQAGYIVVEQGSDRKSVFIPSGMTARILLPGGGSYADIVNGPKVVSTQLHGYGTGCSDVEPMLRLSSNTSLNQFGFVLNPPSIVGLSLAGAGLQGSTSLAHRTSEFYRFPSSLDAAGFDPVRRGQVFYVTVAARMLLPCYHIALQTFDQYASPGLEVPIKETTAADLDSHGADQHSPGTQAPWYMAEFGTRVPQGDGTTLVTLGIKAPYDAAVGEYQIRAFVWAPTYANAISDARPDSFSDRQDPAAKLSRNIALLFNPWVAGDAAFGSTDAPADKFFSNQKTVIWTGDYQGPTKALKYNLRNWNPSVLRAALRGIRGLDATSRQSPVDVSRGLSLSLPAIKAPNSQAFVVAGMIQGLFDGGNAPGGKSTTTYQGNTSPIADFFAVNPQISGVDTPPPYASPIGYADSRVFAGLLTGLARSLGLIARPVSGFAIGDEVDNASVSPGSSVHKYKPNGLLRLVFRQQDGNLPAKMVTRLDNDTRAADAEFDWLMHSWAEVYMARADNAQQDWHVLDGAVRRFAPFAGLQGLGPAPRAAVKFTPLAPQTFVGYNTDYLASAFRAKGRVVEYTQQDTLAFPAQVARRLHVKVLINGVLMEIAVAGNLLTLDKDTPPSHVPTTFTAGGTWPGAEDVTLMYHGAPPPGLESGDDMVEAAVSLNPASEADPLLAVTAGVTVFNLNCPQHLATTIGTRTETFAVADDGDLIGRVGSATLASVPIDGIDCSGIGGGTIPGSAFLPWLTKTNTFVSVITAIDQTSGEESFDLNYFNYPTPSFKVTLVPASTHLGGWAKAVIDSDSVQPISLTNIRLSVNGGDTLMLSEQTINNGDGDGGSALALHTPQSNDGEFSDTAFNAGSLAASGTFHREVWFYALAPDSGIVSVAFGADQIKTQVTQSSVDINPCGADFNNSGGVSVQDLFSFLAAYFAQSGSVGPGYSADINHSNSVTVQDLFDFLAVYFAGC